MSKRLTGDRRTGMRPTCSTLMPQAIPHAHAPPVGEQRQQVEDADCAVAVEARILGIAEGVATMHQDIVCHPI
ncbi:MAG: hypothetical protein IH988_00740 [Planctomycetes bacterium]|nr:hypothetical protein [Planctomycetota bacterium]